MLVAGERARVDLMKGAAPQAQALHVAYVLEAYETFIVDEINELRRQGHRVTVLNAFRPLPLQDPVKEATRRDSLYFPDRYVGVPAANARAFLTHPGRYLRGGKQLFGEPGTFHMLPLGAWFARIVREGGIEHVHATFGTRTATLARIVSRLSGVPFSFTTHAYDIFIRNPTLEWKAREASFVRTISKYNRRFIGETYPGVPLDRVHVRYLGVDPARFAFIDALPPAPPFRIVSVGRLAGIKGHDLLIDACRRLLDKGYAVDCTIVGDGQLRERHEKQIESLHVGDHVHLTGARPHEEVRQLLNRAHLFVLASRTRRTDRDQDGIPVALMEAMAMGLPVVSTTVSGIPELIQDGVSGLLVPPENPEALTDAMARMLDDAAMADRLRRAGRRTIETTFDQETNTREFAKLFRS